MTVVSIRLHERAAPPEKLPSSFANRAAFPKARKERRFVTRQAAFSALPSDLGDKSESLEHPIGEVIVKSRPMSDLGDKSESLEHPIGEVIVKSRPISIPLDDNLKRAIGKIDRELRGPVTAAPLLRPDSPQMRLESALAAAYVGGTLGFTLDTYVSPDGVVITRKTTAGGVACYMSGTVNFVPGILHDSERPQKVKCPSNDEDWKR